MTIEEVNKWIIDKCLACHLLREATGDIQVTEDLAGIRAIPATGVITDLEELAEFQAMEVTRGMADIRDMAGFRGMAGFRDMAVIPDTAVIQDTIMDMGTTTIMAIIMGMEDILEDTDTVSMNRH